VKTIYIETTVVSYYTARPSRDVIIAARQQSTQTLWPRLVSEFESYVSVLVREEASKGDESYAALRLNALEGFAILEVDETAGVVASAIMRMAECRESFPRMLSTSRLPR